MVQQRCSHKGSVEVAEKTHCDKCGECFHKNKHDTKSGGRLCDDCGKVLKRGETAIASPDAIDVGGPLGM